MEGGTKPNQALIVIKIILKYILKDTDNLRKNAKITHFKTVKGGLWHFVRE